MKFGSLSNNSIVKRIRFLIAFRFPTQVPESVVRWTAIGVGTTAGAYVLTGWLWLPLFLAVDFAVRCWIYPKASPIGLGARFLAQRFPLWGNSWVYTAPKRFAAGIGFSMMVTVVLLDGVWHLNIPAFTLAAVLVVFSALSALFGFCLGCKIYGLLVQVGLIDESGCPTCATNGK